MDITPSIPYDYCSCCFDKLSIDDMVVIKGYKWDVCKTCEPKVFKPEDYE